MTVARASTTFGRTVLRRTATQTRSQAWRRIGRRGYASAEHAKKSSDLPWMIGSVVATVPAAVWLIGQAPKKSDHHGPAHHDKEEEAAEEEPQEEEKPSEDDSSDDAKTDKTEDSEDEDKDDSKDEKKEDSKEETEGKDGEKEESKEEDKDDSKQEAKDEKEDDSKDEKEESADSNKDEHGYEKPGPNAPGQINWNPSLGKGPGEGQKVGTRKPTEKKGEKDAASDYSGAKNPYLDDDEKSKKGEGLKDTMKIHGTVDSNRPLRGDGKPKE